MTLSSILVSSKFAPPRIGLKAVARLRLLARLREARQCALVLITGSAGFGKTTLLAQWRQELLAAGAEVSWLLLGPGDAQAHQLWNYLAHALARLGLATEDEVLLLAGQAQPELRDAVVAALVNAAAARGKELFLMLDDYHYADDQSIHDFIYQLLIHAPDNLHLVLASRSRPPLPTGRLLGHGQLVEITADELPFNAREMADFLTCNLSRELAPQALRQVYQRSLGWPAALQLVAARFNRAPQSVASLAEPSERAGDLDQYLEEEVLRDLPPATVEFLETISLCLRFNAELAAALSGRSDAAELLQRIEADNLFLSRIETEEGHDWYRLHRLFADLLVARSVRHGAEWARAKHARACRWFAEHNLVAEAVQHARLAGDIDFAIALVTRAASAVQSLAHLGMLLRWVEDLAPEQLHSNSKLLALAGWTLVMSGKANAADRCVDRLAACMSTAATADSERDQQLNRQLLLIRAGIALARDDTQAAERCLAALGELLPADAFQASVVVIGKTLCLAATGDFDAIQRLFRQWHQARIQQPLRDHEMVAAGSLFIAAQVEGDMLAIERDCPALLAQADAVYGRRSSCASICAVFLASACLERERLGDAQELLASVGELLRLATPEVMIQTSLARARLHRLQRDPHAALAVLASAEHSLHERRIDRGVALMLAAQAVIFLGLGDARRAAQIQVGLDALARRHADGGGWRGEIPAIAALAAARLSLAEGRSEDALGQLTLAGASPAAHNRRRTLVIIDLLASAAHADLGQPQLARQQLAAALAAAHSLGLLRTLRDEFDAHDRLLALFGELLASGDGAAGYYAEYLAAAAPLPTTHSPSPMLATTGAARNSVTPAAHGITEREAAILRLLAQSMSNKRIALALNLSVGTVKWNLCNIYVKLGVSSRYDALTWARNHNLL